MIVDTHTHLMWYPDHVSEEFAQEALNSKLVKMKMSGGQVHAAHLDLVAHLPRIGDFWERTLLDSGSYTGQPMEVHRRLHASQPLTPLMFDRWLELWSSAVDRSWSGPVAQQAKAAAIRIAAALQRKLTSGPDLLHITPMRSLL